MISWSSTECLGTLQSGTLSDRAQSGGHKNRIESCSWACRAIGLVFLSGATGQTARLANARLLPDRLSCQIAPDINRAIGARLARSLSSDQYKHVWPSLQPNPMVPPARAQIQPSEFFSIKSIYILFLLPVNLNSTSSPEPWKFESLRFNAKPTPTSAEYEDDDLDIEQLSCNFFL